MLNMWEIARIMQAFRERYHLSKAKASRVLDVSVNLIRSLEEGFDVTTGLPFHPRESTLRQLAVKMTEFGYPVSCEQLMAAAQTEQTRTAPEKQSEKPPHYPEPPPPLSERPTHGEYPLTDWEWSIIKEAMDMGMSSTLDTDRSFLDRPPEDRRYLVKHLESFIESVRLHKKWVEQDRMRG